MISAASRDPAEAPEDEDRRFLRSAGIGIRDSVWGRGTAEGHNGERGMAGRGPGESEAHPAFHWRQPAASRL